MKREKGKGVELCRAMLTLSSRLGGVQSWRADPISDYLFLEKATKLTWRMPRAWCDIEWRARIAREEDCEWSFWNGHESTLPGRSQNAFRHQRAIFFFSSARPSPSLFFSPSSLLLLFFILVRSQVMTSRARYRFVIIHQPKTRVGWEKHQTSQQANKPNKARKREKQERDEKVKKKKQGEAREAREARENE